MSQSPGPFLHDLFDLLLFPLGKKSAWWGIIAASIITALVVLLAYRFLSRPEHTRKAKDRIKAHILALRIYKDFPGVIVLSFLKSLFATCRYVLQNIIPLIAITPALFILFLQMDIRFGSRPFHKNESIVVKAKFNSDLNGVAVELQGNPKVRPLMNPVRIRALREINWKLLAVENGLTSLRFKFANQTIEKKLAIGDPFLALTPEINSSKMYRFFYSSESLLPKDSALASISLSYPGRRILLGKFSASWIVHYLLLVLVIVLALKKRFGVEF